METFPSGPSAPAPESAGHHGHPDDPPAGPEPNLVFFRMQRDTYHVLTLGFNYTLRGRCRDVSGEGEEGQARNLDRFENFALTVHWRKVLQTLSASKAATSHWGTMKKRSKVCTTSFHDSPAFSTALQSHVKFSIFVQLLHTYETV